MEEWRSLPCVYFPMYAPLTSKDKALKKKKYDKLLDSMSVKERNIKREEITSIESATTTS